jgi:MoxR-like ATPase
MSTTYPFRLIDHRREGPLEDPGLLRKRPFTELRRTFQDDARLFEPGEDLETSMNTALAVGLPLLVTGEPGTGKTQAAYYAAWKLGVEPVLHFQVKSDSTARDLLYSFDTIQYFHDAHLARPGEPLPDKQEYLEHRELWEALDSLQPRVLLIDEIDKAPRDFPNDLLHELDKMEFVVRETRKKIEAPEEGMRPIVFITSNSERRLPEPFLRRCVYHHIDFSDELAWRAVEVRRQRGEYGKLSEDFLKMALQRFLALRERNLRKPPATGELLVWLRVLALAAGTYPARLEERDLAKLPYLGALLKDHEDIRSVESEKGRL